MLTKDIVNLPPGKGGVKWGEDGSRNPMLTVVLLEEGACIAKRLILMNLVSKFVGNGIFFIFQVSRIREAESSQPKCIGREDTMMGSIF